MTFDQVHGQMVMTSEELSRCDVAEQPPLTNVCNTVKWPIRFHQAWGVLVCLKAGLFCIFLMISEGFPSLSSEGAFLLQSQQIVLIERMFVYGMRDDDRKLERTPAGVGVR